MQHSYRSIAMGKRGSKISAKAKTRRMFCARRSGGYGNCRKGPQTVARTQSSRGLDPTSLDSGMVRKATQREDNVLKLTVVR